MAIALDLTVFRELFPEFSTISDTTLMAVADGNGNYIDSPCTDNQLAQGLMTAHQLKMAEDTEGGARVINAATIDGVQVQLQAPIAQDNWTLFLSSTSYGIRLLGILDSCASGGMYVGGWPERSAFRHLGGWPFP